MSGWTMFLTIVGLAAITVVTRCFFLIPQRELPMPGWLKQGLRYAPLAALAAIIAPEVLLTDGQLTLSWRDPRLYAVAAASAWFWWRRSILGTIVFGSIVMVGLRAGLGW